MSDFTEAVKNLINPKRQLEKQREKEIEQQKKEQQLHNLSYLDAQTKLQKNLPLHVRINNYNTQELNKLPIKANRYNQAWKRTATGQFIPIDARDNSLINDTYFLLQELASLGNSLSDNERRAQILEALRDINYKKNHDDTTEV